MVRRILKWAAYAIGMAFVCALLVAGIMWLLAERRLSQNFPTAAAPLRVSSADPVEGGRLSKVYGCTDCHGVTLTGRDFYGLQSPNLRRLAREYGREGFAFAVRHGIRPDGTAVTWSMPSDFFSVMADDQIADIQAYLASLPPVADDRSASRLPLKHLGVALGNLLLIPEVWRPEPTPAAAPKPGNPGFGPYFARVACAECHGFDLQGRPGDTPPLAVAKAYDRAQFRRFLKTGKNLNGEDVPMMSGVARGRLTHMTDTEVDALHDWLLALPNPGE